MFQEDTGLRLIDDLQGVIRRRQALPKCLTFLGGKRCNRLGQAVGFHRKDGECLIAAPIAAGMAGHLPRITLAHDFGKGFNAPDELLISLICFRCQRTPFMCWCRCASLTGEPSLYCLIGIDSRAKFKRLIFTTPYFSYS